MTLLTTTQAAKPGLGARRLRTLCSQGRIPGAQLLGGIWLLPAGFTVSPGKPVGNPNWKRRAPRR